MIAFGEFREETCGDNQEANRIVPVVVRIVLVDIEPAVIAVGIEVEIAELLTDCRMYHPSHCLKECSQKLYFI